MTSSRGSQTLEASEVPPSRSERSGTDGSTPRAPHARRNRALVSPIDSSLALWGEGRRDRVAELEEELCQHDAEQQKRGSGGSTEAARDGEQGEKDSTVGSKPSATPGKTAARKQHTESSPGRDSARRGAGNTSGPSLTATAGGSRGRAPLSSTPLLEERLGRWGAGWRPPALRELPRGGEGFFSAWTHVGQPERFELVKSVNRSVGASGAPLTDAELEWAVLGLEEVEERMAALDFSTAAGVLQRVLGRCPGLTLAYYRLALCLLAARGAHASRQARLLLHCAMFLEGAENQHLRAAVDLVLRIFRNDAIPEAYWSEDYPRSLGDLRALEAAVDHLL